ncbi:MAG: hypothetical protein F4038_01695 [Chloroflexi bacterium]|nr:hypothetical protein [Chloroflexota bacterium]MYJ91754.1 hypothetical protein [Chloroflexota bacterium]
MHAAAPQTLKPPVPYTDAAIKAGIAHEAANGPSHVRIKALGMMARITGLFEQGKQLGKQLAHEVAQAKDQTTEKLSGVAARVAGLMNGTLQPTAEELAHFEPDNPLDDEDHPRETDDEPP